MESMTMNHYGAMAQQHWQNERPVELATIENPERFFSELGEQVAAAVAARTDQLLSSQPPAEGFKARYAQNQTARQTAEDEILRTMVFTDPASDQTITVTAG